MKLHRFDLSSRRSGFTLLELMVVIVIVGVLLGAFIVSGGGIFGQADVNKTKTRLQTLAQLINSYRSVENDYPDDRLPRNASATAMNANSEALCLAFFDPSYTGQKPKLDWLGNTDEDSSSRQLTIFADKQLKEIVDGWGNPIVYFESMHYDRAAQCFAGEDGMFDEQTVTPARDEGTGLALGQGAANHRALGDLHQVRHFVGLRRGDAALCLGLQRIAHLLLLCLCSPQVWRGLSGDAASKKGEALERQVQLHVTEVLRILTVSSPLVVAHGAGLGALAQAAAQLGDEGAVHRLGRQVCRLEFYIGEHGLRPQKHRCQSGCDKGIRRDNHLVPGTNPQCLVG